MIFKRINIIKNLKIYQLNGIHQFTFDKEKKHIEDRHNIKLFNRYQLNEIDHFIFCKTVHETLTKCFFWFNRINSAFDIACYTCIPQYLDLYTNP